MIGLVPEASVEELVAGYQQLIAMAHANGVKIVFAEMSPWKGYTRDLLKTGQVVWSGRRKHRQCAISLRNGCAPPIKPTAQSTSIA